VVEFKRSRDKIKKMKGRITHWLSLVLIAWCVMAWWLGLVLHNKGEIVRSRRKQMRRKKEVLRRGERENHTKISEFKVRRSCWASYISFTCY
jgi:hypothetical protein